MKIKFDRAAWLRLAALIFVIALTIYLLSIADRIRHLAYLGYPGIFLVSILANATIIVPLPTLLITSAMGAIFDPFWVAIVTGAGATIGELTGYLAGFSGSAVIERRDWYERVSGWMKKYGDLTILVLAFIPNPLFDVAGIVAGALKLPIYRYLFWTMIGKSLKMMVFAYGGASIFNGLFKP